MDYKIYHENGIMDQIKLNFTTLIFNTHNVNTI